MVEDVDSGPHCLSPEQLVESGVNEVGMDHGE